MKPKKNKVFMGTTIRPRGNGWQVDFGRRKGKRKQLCYATIPKAEQAIREYKRVEAELDRTEAVEQQNKRLGLHSLPVRDRRRIADALETLGDRMPIDDQAMTEYVEALDALGGRARVKDAVGYFLKHTEPAGGAVTLSALFEEYQISKERANRRAETKRDIKSRPGRYVREFPGVYVHDVTETMLQDWMDSNGYTGTTRDNWRRAFVSFFGFAVKRKHAADNPATAIDRIDKDETVPEALSPERARAVLRAAEKDCPEMAPYLSIGLFAGLRAAEIKALKWSDIDLAKRRITVRPEVAKKRRQRYVEISNNLLEWLAPHVKPRGGVYYCRYAFDRVRKAAGVLDNWPPNSVRHSFGSYYLAMHEDAPKTALQMGHSGGQVDVLFNHYRELVTPEDAERYWRIRPSDEGKIIRMAGTD